jgi:hypothetical protein
VYGESNPSLRKLFGLQGCVGLWLYSRATAMQMHLASCADFISIVRLQRFLHIAVWI